MSPLSQDATDVLTVARELKILDEGQIRMLQQLFTNRLDQELVQQLVVGRERTLAATLFKLVVATHAEGTLGYVLRFMADLSQLCPTLVDELAHPQAAGFLAADPAPTFAAICDDHRQVPGVFNPAVFLFAATLARGSKTGCVERADLSQKFLTTCAAALGSADLRQPGLEYSLHAVCEFLRSAGHRVLFRQAGLVAQIPRLLTLAIADNSPAVVQLQYEVLLAARLLSFDYECLVELHAAKAIATVHRALQKASKEKVVRMALYVIKNFINAQATYTTAHTSHDFVGTAVLALARCNSGKGPRFYGDLIGVGVLKTAKQLQRKKYGDEDISAELDAIVDTLQSNFDDLSGFAEYKGEVDSGVLEWSPAHTSGRFWKEHSAKFEANQCEVLRALAQLLSSPASTDLTLAIACHDFGELVRHHQGGRALLDLEAARGVKERLMGLMSHENPDVAKAALTAVQKVLVDRY